MDSLPDQPVQPPLLDTGDCGVESGWDEAFGRTHYCLLEPAHEGDHFMIQKPEYLRYRVFGSEPEPPRSRCFRCHLPYMEAEMVEGICQNCYEDELKQAYEFDQSRRLV